MKGEFTHPNEVVCIVAMAIVNYMEAQMGDEAKLREKEEQH
jgi:hypothetical protein